MHRIILVTGASGQVGWELMRRASRFGLTAIGLSHQQLDITEDNAVRRAVTEFKPELVINAAAYTAVDKAETERDLAYSVNRDGAANLAMACAEAGIPLIHISTDYVFDGSKTGAYTEDDPVAPLSIYGASKEAGECTVRKHLDHHLILRTAWVYGVQGHNFVKTILRLAGERDALRVVADQYGCPTAAGDIADTILSVAGKIFANNPISWGTYHYCGSGVTTWHGFAEAIIAAAAPYHSRTVTVQPITTQEYPTAARRPANSVLDCDKIQANFSISPRSWQAALGEVIAEIYSKPH